MCPGGSADDGGRAPAPRAGDFQFRQEYRRQVRARLIEYTSVVARSTELEYLLALIILSSVETNALLHGYPTMGRRTISHGEWQEIRQAMQSEASG